MAKSGTKDLSARVKSKQKGTENLEATINPQPKKRKAKTRKNRKR